MIENREPIVPFLLECIGVNNVSHIIPVSEEWSLIVVKCWDEIPEGFRNF